MSAFDRSDPQVVATQADADGGIGTAARVFWISALAASALAVLTVHGSWLMRAPLEQAAANTALGELMQMTDRAAPR